MPIDGGESIALSPLGDYVYMQNGYIGDVVFESGESSYLPSRIWCAGYFVDQNVDLNRCYCCYQETTLNDILVDGYILETDKVPEM
jgi:hypothetical protein